MKDVLADFNWHSSIGIDDAIENNKRFVTKVAATKTAMIDFVAAGDYLVHKSTNALWRMSDDKGYIEPVFGSDILTEDELRAIEGSEDE